MASSTAKALEPGKYTVILEPAASIDLLQNMMRSMDARNADEGRSFLSKKGGGTRLGEKLFDERVNIYSDPSNIEIPTSGFGGGGGGRMGGGGSDGRPQEKVSWIENGVVKNVYFSRFWADKKGVIKKVRIKRSKAFINSKISIECTKKFYTNPVNNPITCDDCILENN